MALVGAGTAFAANENCVRVVVAESSGEKMTFDPAYQLSNDDASLVYATYNRLMDLDDNFEVVPELATSWEQSDDGRTWTFHLRQGVTFHDGSEFDAADVVYTFRRMLDASLALPPTPVLSFLDPAGITAADPLTVQFTTKEPVAELPLMLTVKWSHIIPEGVTAEMMKNKSYGTGPFMTTEPITPETQVRILAKNPNYWKEGLPKAECLANTVVQEGLTAAVALQSGDVDLLQNVDSAVLPTLQGDPNIQLLPTGAGTSYLFYMQTDTPPFDDVRVRRALKMVVDRQQMIDTVLLGFGEPGNDNPIPPSWPLAYTGAVPERDIEGAKALLAEAGYSDGLTVELYSGEALPGGTRFAEAYKAMAAEAGINVEIVVSPADSFWDVIWLQKPFVLSGWVIRPPFEALTIAYLSDAEWNESHWRRPEYDGLVISASKETDAAKRVQMYQLAQKMLAEEGGLILPMFQHQVAALRAECTGYKPHAQTSNMNFEEISCTR
jgi:peptide/nickel transport system substrate-binding protein